MISSLSFQAFLANPNAVILDVRSPAEFAHAHIPGALNLPLFDNAERSQVGTLYCRVSPNAAMICGMRIVLGKLKSLTLKALDLIGEKQPYVYCARGGLRSASVASLLTYIGRPAVTLKGGYKVFRRSVLSVLDQERACHVLGGFTGSGKTAYLARLASKGEPVLDLEAFANHRGSSFGALGLGAQPSQEQFENDLAFALLALPKDKPFWVEDESRMIGKCRLPEALYTAMQRAPFTLLETTLDERLSQLKKDYGSLPKEAVIEATMRLEKRLGSARCQQIMAAIQSDDSDTAIRLMLDYYDKAYLYSLERSGRIHSQKLLATLN